MNEQTWIDFETLLFWWTSLGLTIQVEINRIKDIEYDCMSIRIIDFVS